MIKAGIIGGAGYTAGELIRLLLNHPETEIVFINSSSNAGNRITDVHEGLYGETDLRFTDQLPLDAIDVLFFCTAHGDTKKFMESHNIPEDLKIIDLSMDYRIKSDDHDFIYGLPEQTMDSWKQSVEALLALNPEHLSCYGLKLEQGTPLYERRDSEPMADDDTQADMYLCMVDRLRQAGYAQYEISNFAQPGFESRHNCKYWLGEEYMGFGPSAHSYFGGRRYGFVRDLAAYVQGVLHNGTIISESEDIPLREQAKEYIMLRMRTIWGVEEHEYRNQYYMNFVPLDERFHEYEDYGWATCTDRRWHFTPSGFLLSTPLIGDLLAIQEETVQETKGPIRKKRRESEQKA